MSQSVSYQAHLAVFGRPFLAIYCAALLKTGQFPKIPGLRPTMCQSVSYHPEVHPGLTILFTFGVRA